MGAFALSDAGVPAATEAVRIAALSPRLLGISHLGLSVPDLTVADFFVDVLGFESISDDPAFRMVMHRTARSSCT